MMVESFADISLDRDRSSTKVAVESEGVVWVLPQGQLGFEFIPSVFAMFGLWGERGKSWRGSGGILVLTPRWHSHTDAYPCDVDEVVSCSGCVGCLDT